MYNFILIISSLVFLAETISGEACLEGELSSSCQCIKSGVYGNKVEIQCANIEIANLYSDFSKISSSTESVYELQIRESDLSTLEGLPERFHDITSFRLQNVGMSVDNLRKIISGDTPLDDLKHLLFDNAKLPRLSWDTFGTKPKLEHLTLNQDGINKIDDDAFEQWADSLKVLRMRENKLQSIPIAIKSLANLEELDLTSNEIKNVSREMTEMMRNNLRHLNKLHLDQLSCSCEVSKSDFAKWVREKKFENVLCSASIPKSFIYLSQKELCPDGGNGSNSNLVSVLLLAISTFFFIKRNY